jgi:hypothetical protein
LPRSSAAFFATNTSSPRNLSRYDAEDVEPILEQVHRAKLGNFRKR